MKFKIKLNLVFFIAFCFFSYQKTFSQCAAPTVKSPIYYCQNSPSSAVTAIPLSGATLNWYATSTSTPALASAPTPSTALVGPQSYYVSQTVGLCESSRVAIVVNVVADNGATILGLLCDSSQILQADRASSVFFDWALNPLISNFYNYSYTVDGGAPVTGTTSFISHLQVFGMMPGQSATLTLTSATHPCVPSKSITCSVPLPCGSLTTTPTFNAIAPICSGSVAPVLPTTSTNGITGTWNPATVNNTATATYTFTPTLGQCAAVTILNVTVLTNVIPTFSPIPSICSGSVSPVLRTTSNNFIIGTWTPSTISNTTSGIYTFTPSAGQCATSSTLSIVVSPKPDPIIATVNDLHDIYVDNTTVVQTLLLDSQLSGSYSFIWYESNVEIIGATSSTYLVDTFSANATRNYTVRATNSVTGCLATSLAFAVNQSPVPAPTGNATQLFTVGQTLANIAVAGTNIQWYSGATGQRISSIQKINTLLPMNTLLVNGVTYFASQTINGYESPTRLAVTAQFSLSTNGFDLKNLEYSPNPIVNVLNIKSTEIIKNVAVYNILGQEVSRQKFNDSELKLELSHLVSGNYFIKVESGNKQQVFKVIKK